MDYEEHPVWFFALTQINEIIGISFLVLYFECLLMDESHWSADGQAWRFLCEKWEWSIM